MVNCKLNKLILVSNAYYYMQEVFSFKKDHTSQLYYEGLLLSKMCLITATNIAIKPHIN